MHHASIYVSDASAHRRWLLHERLRSRHSLKSVEDVEVGQVAAGTLVGAGRQ